MKYTEIETGTVTEKVWSAKLRKEVPTGITFPASLVEFETVQKGNYKYIIANEDTKKWLDGIEEYAGATGFRTEKSARAAFRKLTR